VRLHEDVTGEHKTLKPFKLFSDLFDCDPGASKRGVTEVGAGEEIPDARIPQARVTDRKFTPECRSTSAAVAVEVFAVVAAVVVSTAVIDVATRVAVAAASLLYCNCLVLQLQ